MTTEVFCSLAGECAGCLWIDTPYSEQLERKAESVRQALSRMQLSFADVPIHSVGFRAERSRLDLTLETIEGQAPRLGLYGSKREVVDMQACPMALPALESWLQELRTQPLPTIRKGSLRLRVSPGGQFGVWIDFSNQDIKTLLDEQVWLRFLMSKAIVEIGQRNKRLVDKEGRLKLVDPEHFAWFETYLGEELRPQPLYLPIAGFTQTGFAANRLLIETAMSFVRQTGAEDVLELFCGSGNFTLALASTGLKVRALELDNFAVEGLSRAVEEAGLRERVSLQRQDLYRVRSEDLRASVWLVDPPRSGLKSVLDRLEDLTRAERPKHLIYISCFLESWGQDAERLLNLGYKMTRLEGVDQFPNTPHCEWVSLFSC